MDTYATIMPPIRTPSSVLHWFVIFPSKIPLTDQGYIAKALLAKVFRMLLLELGTDYLVTLRNCVKLAIIEQYGYPYSHQHTYLQCAYGAVPGIHTAFNELILPFQSCTHHGILIDCHHSLQTTAVPILVAIPLRCGTVGRILWNT